MTEPDSPPMHRIGILGGTFDPVHFGHLRPALDLADALGLDTLRLLPCHQPSHRGRPGASTMQRIAMLRHAIEGVPRLMVDTRESERDKPSYSVDTLQSFRDEFADAQLLFFMGLDAFQNFCNWHQWQRILELAHLVVVPRPAVQLDGDAEHLMMSRKRDSREELQDLAGGILMQPVTQMEISATAIRAMVAAGRDIRYMTPDSVCRYIAQHQLYRIE